MTSSDTPAPAPRLRTTVPHAARCTLSVTLALCVAACSHAPRTADWQLEAKAAMDRAVAAYLRGDDRVEVAEMARVRQHVASTGQTERLANAELLRCAAGVASLVFEPCTRFEVLRRDATDAQRAYADYLRGQHTAATVPQLPPAQREAASRTALDTSALASHEDPMSTLVAAGVLLQTGKIHPTVVDQAVATASTQGWRRPLLAWLGVQAQHAKAQGRFDDEARIRRRMAMVLGEAQTGE